MTDGRRRVCSARALTTLPLTALLLVVVAPGLAVAAPGDIDASFSEDGRVIGSDPRRAEKVAVQADGSILVVGGRDFEGGPTVVRYTPAGDLDPSFAGDGQATLELGADVALRNLEVQADGSILVSGQVRVAPEDYDLLFARLRLDGSLDPSFAGDGTVQIDAGNKVGAGRDLVADMTLMSDGGIAAVAQGNDGEHLRVVVRLLPDGSLDQSFAEDGLLYVPGAQGSEIAAGGDGSLLVGVTQGGLGTVTRLREDGSVDRSFGLGGTAWLDFPGSYGTYIQSLELSAQREVYLAGIDCNPRAVGCRHAVFRLTRLGDLDPTFGEEGLVPQMPGGALVLDQQGRILVAGSSAPAGRFYRTLAVTRLLTDGERDDSFGKNGTTYAYFGLDEDAGLAFDVAVAPDGKIVASGYGEREEAEGHAVIRFQDVGGPENRDADRFRDAIDRCEFLPGNRHAGCPTVRRTLDIERQGARGLTGQLSADVPACLFRERIDLLQARTGVGRLVSEPAVEVPKPAWARGRGRWTVRGVGPGRYYAVARGHFDRQLGYCQRVRTKTIRNR